MFLKSKLAKAALCALAVAAGGSALAATVNQGLTSGVLNTVEDQDREAFIDANGDNILSVGDVFIGFVRIDNFLPKGLSAGNQVYGLISNQIIANPVGNVLSLGATTVVGLRLEDLTSDMNTAGALVALYDKPAPYTTDLINSPPPAATSIFDYINFILTGSTLRLTAEISAADDFFTVVNNVPIGTATSALATLSTSLTVNSFTGGLSINYNDTGYIFTDAVDTLNPLTGLGVNQLGIANGATRGGRLEGNEAIWGNVPGWTQCKDANGGEVSCGFVTDADFFVVPVRVPEPGSLALIGAALLGVVGARRATRSTKA